MSKNKSGEWQVTSDESKRGPVQNAEWLPEHEKALADCLLRSGASGKLVVETGTATVREDGPIIILEPAPKAAPRGLESELILQMLADDIEIAMRMLRIGDYLMARAHFAQVNEKINQLENLTK